MKNTNKNLIRNSTVVLVVLLGAFLQGCEAPTGELPHMSPPAVQSSALTGVSAVGTGASPGLYAEGGNESGSGVHARGGTSNGHGVVAEGLGTGMGVVGFSGAHGWFGVYGVGQGDGGSGIGGQGSGVGAGGIFSPGIASTPTHRTSALVVQSGDIDMSGVPMPAPTTPIANAVTPGNTIKAAVKFTTDGAGGIVMNSGFNVASVTFNHNAVRIVFATPFANTHYIGMVSADQAIVPRFTAISTTIADVRAYLLNNGSSNGDLANLAGLAQAGSYYVVVLGEQ